MPLEYTNRQGDRYYVLQGRSKSGKPTYHCSRKLKPDSQRVDELPPEFEIREDPQRSIVTVRRVRPSRIAAFERDLVRQIADEVCTVPFLIDLELNGLVIYAVDADQVQSLVEMSNELSAVRSQREANAAWLIKRARFDPTVRFDLRDEAQRTFSAKRWCYRGSIDDWIDVGPSGPLDTLARTVLPHVGRQSYFDLI